MRAVSSILVGALMLIACKEDPPEDPSDVRPADCTKLEGWRFVESTLLPGCQGYGCHSDQNIDAVVVLEPGAAYANIVKKPSHALPTMSIVEPGVPSRSFLYRKLMGTQRAACEAAGMGLDACGKKMPAEAWSPLPKEWIENVRAWIACGAEPAN